MERNQIETQYRTDCTKILVMELKQKETQGGTPIPHIIGTRHVPDMSIDPLFLRQISRPTSPNTVHKYYGTQPRRDTIQV